MRDGLAQLVLFDLFVILCDGTGNETNVRGAVKAIAGTTAGMVPSFPAITRACSSSNDDVLPRTVAVL